jgi:hypothetical protein
VLPLGNEHVYLEQRVKQDNQSPSFDLAFSSSSLMSCPISATSTSLEFQLRYAPLGIEEGDLLSEIASAYRLEQILNLKTQMVSCVF